MYTKILFVKIRAVLLHLPLICSKCAEISILLLNDPKNINSVQMIPFFDVKWLSLHSAKFSLFYRFFLEKKKTVKIGRGQNQEQNQKLSNSTSIFFWALPNFTIRNGSDIIVVKVSCDFHSSMLGLTHCRGRARIFTWKFVPAKTTILEIEFVQWDLTEHIDCKTQIKKHSTEYTPCKMPIWSIRAYIVLASASTLSFNVSELVSGDYWSLSLLSF